MCVYREYHHASGERHPGDLSVKPARCCNATEYMYNVSEATQKAQPSPDTDGDRTGPGSDNSLDRDVLIGPRAFMSCSEKERTTVGHCRPFSASHSLYASRSSLQSFPHLSRRCLVFNANPTSCRAKLPLFLDHHSLPLPSSLFSTISPSGCTSVETKKKKTKSRAHARGWPHTPGSWVVATVFHCDCLIQKTTSPPPFSRLNLFKSPPMWFTRTATKKKSATPAPIGVRIGRLVNLNHSTCVISILAA